MNLLALVWLLAASTDPVIELEPAHRDARLATMPYPREAPAAGNADASAQLAAPAMAGKYRISGNRELFPATIGDDGERTFITWDPAQPLPAVFSLDRLGREQMVDGYMREGTFTIDRVYPQLVFRIDKALATARRILAKDRNQRPRK